MSTSQRLISAAELSQTRLARYNSRKRVNQIALTLSLAAMLFGLAPAVQAAYSEVAASLGNRGVGAGMRHGQSRTRRLLVVAQVALSLVLLAGAGLFTRTLVNLNAVDPGFRAERLLKFSVVPMMSGYTEERSQTFFRDLRARLAAIPGVESVGAANPGPFTNSESAGSVTVEGYHARPGEDSGASLHAISAGYFKTIGARIVAGRELTDADEQSGQKLVLINEAFAKKYFSGTSPLGRRVAIGGGTPDREVVGVVGDVKQAGLDTPPRPEFYVPFEQERGWPADLAVRTAVDPLSMLQAIRRESDVYVMLLTARSEETDRVVGLTVGADDYLTKPFSPREVVARVKAAVRREMMHQNESAVGAPAATAPTEVLDFEDLTIDRMRRHVEHHAQPIHLSALEFDLLAAMASAPGRVWSRPQLLEKVWGYDFFGDERVVDVHIRSLRKALGDDANDPRVIATVRGVGYRFIPEPPA